MHNINSKIGNVEIRLDLTRIDKGLEEAQKKLNMQVTADCDPLVPMRQGGLRGSARYPEGIYGGSIEYDTPYAHYQYMGEVYGPNIPIKDSQGNVIGWRSPKVKYPTGRSLSYSTPGTGSAWFETAKKQHRDEWIALVDKTVKK